MKKKNGITSLALSGMFLGLALILPFLTGQIKQIGSMLCPMHIPVILCGYICGGSWGFAVGLIAPLLRSALFGMPALFPTAVSMAFELAAYGFFSGIFYSRINKSRCNIYISLILSMLLGRLIWGIAQFTCLDFDISRFPFSAFITAAFTKALPGIALQLFFIPVFVMIYEKKLK